MHRQLIRRAALLAGGFLGVWLCIKYLLPIAMPFLLGFLLALAAEPAVRTGTRLLKLPRWAASGIAVTFTLVLLMTLLGGLGAVAVKELGILAGRLPDLQETIHQTTDRLRQLAQNAASHVPQQMRPLVDRSVEGLFTTGSEMVEQATTRLPAAISGFLSRVPDGALGVGTGILSGFLFSARLPKLKGAITLPPQVQDRILPALRQGKKAVLGWLKAQLKLCLITWVVLLVGFLLLKIPYAPLVAGAVALVDAVPLLGTGTVLVPWAVVCLVQRQHLRSVGLLCLYAVAFVTRTVLEPRLVGRQLGLDPLVTLVFLYLGYRFWGILGMLLAPILAAAITAATAKPAEA